MPKIKQSIKQSVMLEGDALLKKVKELENLTSVEKAKACGYSTVTTKGKIRVNSMKFLNAVMEAANINLEGKSAVKGGRNASYRVSVQKNGNLLIGSAYTLQMGLNPGDELEIKLGRKHINLRQLGISDSEE